MKHESHQSGMTDNGRWRRTDVFRGLPGFEGHDVKGEGRKELSGTVIINILANGVLSVAMA